ncbi:MAG: Crp/Fnr family transcriptional regulator [Ardenticatenales bacterium]
MSDDAAALRRSFLSSGLSEAQIAWLAGRTQHRTLSAGEVVFQHGDPGNALYIVEDGEVRITVESQTGQPLTLDTVYADEPFGELALIDGEPRSATATAVADTKLLRLHRDDFMELIHGERSALDAVLHTLAEMVRRMNDKLSDTRSPAGKVAKVLLQYDHRHGVPAEGGGRLIKAALSYEDIASIAVLESPSVAQRIMETYQLEHVIERGIEYWTILRIDVLRDAVAGPLHRGV